MRIRTLSVLLCALLVAWPAAAQEQRGSIEGVVKDSTGGVLPGVTVEARSAAGAVLTTMTDANGVYRFPAVLPGTYVVTANLQNFSSGKVSDVLVALGHIKKVDFTLGPAGVAELVTVTVESPIIDVKQSTRATNIRAEQIELLPHNRDFTSLLTQAPGVNYEPKSGSTGIMIDGASAAENRYIIDGMETTDMVHGQSGKALLADLVEEVQIKSSGYTAEYGGSTGGVINVITKSGTNTLSGSLLGSWQGSRVQGIPNPTLRLNLNNSSIAEYITYPKDSYNRAEPGGMFGGPLMKDRAWFFAAYTPTFTTTDRTVTLRANNQSLTKTSKQQAQYFAANQTMQLGDKLRTRIAYNNSWSKTDGLLPSLSGSDPPYGLDTNYARVSTFPNWLLSGNADYIVGPKLFVGIRAGYFRTDQHDSNVPSGSRYTWPTTTNAGFVGTNGVPVPANLQFPTGFTSVLSNTASDHNTLSRGYVQADATWYAHAGGDHQLKFGVQLDRRADDVLSGELGHRVTIRWGQALQGNRGPFGYYSVRSNGAIPKQGFITQGNINTNLVGLFVQDAWAVSDRLTINAGVRTEQERVPAYTTGPGIPVNPIQFQFKDKIAPRAGFAYDIKGDGRWKAYGSWGVFYDIFKLELPRGSFGGEKWLEYYYTLDTFDYSTLDASPSCPPQCSGRLFRGPIDFRHPSTAPGDDIEPNLRPMRSQEAVFGLEHQLSAVTAVQFRFVHKHLDRGIEDTGSLDEQQNEIYIIANPGEGLTKIAYCCPQVNLPKAKRQYDAGEIALEKRLADSWYFRASYTLSRDYGNYPGLSESDENGRSDPNVGRLFDYPLIMFKQDGTPNFGRLPTDRPHQVKVNGIYQFPFGTTVGANEYIESGIPITREIAVIPPNNYPVQYLGRGGDGRTDKLWWTDLYAQHEFKVGGRRRLQINATVLNLFNQRASDNVFVTQVNGAGIKFNEGDFYAGKLNFSQLIAAAAAAGTIVLDPRFLMVNGYQPPIQARFGVKLSF